MAYNFLGLVNDVNERVNEVRLNETNFEGAGNFFSTAKQSVNTAIRHINTQSYEWPFNHVVAEEVLSPNQTRYNFAYDTKTIDFETFRIPRDVTLGNDTSKLDLITYEEYLDNHVGQEYNEAMASLPKRVFRAPDNTFGLVPTPDQAYTLIYEYYKLPLDLVNWFDIPDIPEHFRHVIVDGAMYYVYLFRGNTQDAQLSFDLFQMGIKSMRSLYVNRYDYLRSTMVDRNQFYKGS